MDSDRGAYTTHLLYDNTKTQVHSSNRMSPMVLILIHIITPHKTLYNQIDEIND